MKIIINFSSPVPNSVFKGWLKNLNQKVVTIKCVFEQKQSDCDAGALWHFASFKVRLSSLVRWN